MFHHQHWISSSLCGWKCLCAGLSDKSGRINEISAPQPLIPGQQNDTRDIAMAFTPRSTAQLSARVEYMREINLIVSTAANVSNGAQGEFLTPTCAQLKELAK